MTQDNGNQLEVAPEKQIFVASCITNARDLQRAAKKVLNDQLPNVAYHLAVLSLEEVGKAGIIAATAINEKAKKSQTDGWLKDKLADHTFKLFWALWQASDDVQSILPERFKDTQNMAVIDFMMCLFDAMLFYGDATDKLSFPPKFMEFIQTLMPGGDDDLGTFQSIVAPFSVGNEQAAAEKMTTDAAKKMKVFCDAYLLQKFKNGLPDRIKRLMDVANKEEALVQGTLGTA